MEIGLKHEFLSSKAEDEDDEQRNYKTVRPSYKVKVLGDKGKGGHRPAAATVLCTSSFIITKMRYY